MATVVRNQTVRDQHPLKQGLRLSCYCRRVVTSTVRDQHPLKQGLRQHLIGTRVEDFHVVRDQHPLKQGLRPAFSLANCLPSTRPRPTSTKTRIKTVDDHGSGVNYYARPRPTSTKTRIKTRDVQCTSLTAVSPRPTSTKTRIKTLANGQLSRDTVNVRDQHPLKQGLRLKALADDSAEQEVRDQHPLKQGLRQLQIVYYKTEMRIVRDQHPLKQGLRLSKIVESSAFSRVRDQHPLKQGLRHDTRSLDGY